MSNSSDEDKTVDQFQDQEVCEKDIRKPAPNLGTTDQYQHTFADESDKTRIDVDSDEKPELPQTEISPEPATGHSIQPPTFIDVELNPVRGRLPRFIAGYRTEKRLGEGSFGVVVKCVDEKLGRPVAIKLQKINPMDSNARIDRFLKEARAAGQLRHPNIIPVYEFGEFEGCQFIVYELVEGETLGSWLKKQDCVRTKVGMISTIARALDYAHSLGIIHRDIKPANVLVDSHLGEPHVADFGCAKHDSTDQLQTVDGSVMGTPVYMSPEVCRGQANQADGRSDIWALGIMMYEILAGKRPFHGQLSELLHKIQHSEPRRLTQIDRSISKDLQTIVFKCLEKDVERRYPSARDLADDLDAWVQGRPIKARAVGVVERGWLWSRRNPAVATLLATVASCLALIAAGSIWFSITSARQKADIVNKQTEMVTARVNALGTAAPQVLPTLIADMANLDPDSATLVRKKLAQRNGEARSSFPFNLALYQLARSSGMLDQAAINALVEYVAVGDPSRHLVLLEVASDDLVSYNNHFWNMARNPTASLKTRMLATAILANTDSTSEHWQNEVISESVRHLMLLPAEQLPDWCRLLEPVSPKLKPELELLRDSANGQVRSKVTRIASWLFQNDSAYLMKLALRLDPEHLALLQRNLDRNPESCRRLLADLSEPEQAIGERGQTNLLLISGLLKKHDDMRQVVPEWISHQDLRVQNRLIHEAFKAGMPANAFLHWIENDTPESTKDRSPVLAAALLTLGQANQQQLFQTRREKLKDHLIAIFCEHRDVAVHSSSRWLLNQWGFQADVDKAVTSVQTVLPRDGYSWHEDPNGICFAVFQPVDSFPIGPPKDYAHKPPLNIAATDPVTAQASNIPDRFGIAIYETTEADFRRWEDRQIPTIRQDTSLKKDVATAIAKRLENARRERIKKIGDGPWQELPVATVNWDTVAWFCNGLGKQAGLDEDQLCFRIQFGDRSWQAKAKDQARRLTGYRLPTGNEWEYACRPGNTSRFSFGGPLDLSEYHIWSVENSSNRLQPTGSRKPGRNGLFDTQGNVAEWCLNLFEPSPNKRTEREIRGQNTLEQAEQMSVYSRDKLMPTRLNSRVGFRVARTYPKPKSD